MHTQNKNSELATGFLQSIVPASYTISKATLLKIDKWAPRNPNKSIKIDDVILADAAYMNGMIKNKNITLNKITKYITNQFEENNAKYFMKCITKEEQDYLFHLALLFERKLFPDVLQGGNKNHQVIPVSVVDKRFCDIDTKKTLADKGWKEFFYKMNKGIVKLKRKKDERPLLG